MDSLFVNDSLVLRSPQSSAFQVDLSFLELQDKIDIKIYHRKGCVPTVLNGNDIMSGIDFKLLDIEINERKLEWFAEGESKEGFYVAYQQWLKNWIVLDTLKSRGSSVKSGYSMIVYNLSGENDYKVSYFNADSTFLESKEKSYFSHKKPISFKPSRVVNNLYFSEKTRYQIYDKAGKEMLLSGISDVVDCSTLKGGKNKFYLLVIDNRIARFLKL